MGLYNLALINWENQEELSNDLDNQLRHNLVFAFKTSTEFYSYM